MDSFFAQTFIQLFNVTCVMVILVLWAFTTPKSEQEVVSEKDRRRRQFREKLINWSTSIIKIMTNLQVFCLAFFSLQIVCSTLKLRTEAAADYGQSTDSTLYKFFQSIGLLPNPEMRGYQVSPTFLNLLFLIPKLLNINIYITGGNFINYYIANFPYIVPLPHLGHRSVLYQRETQPRDASRDLEEARREAKWE